MPAPRAAANRSAAPSAAGRPVDLVLVSCAHEENLSVHYVAAAAEQAGFHAAVLGVRDSTELGSLVPKALAHAPRLIGLSLSVQVLAPAYLELARALRAHRFVGHLCCGGHFATLAWRELLREQPAIDSIVLHEGERTIVELMKVLPDRAEASSPLALATVPGLAFRDAAGEPVATTARPLEVLDDLPWPTRVQPTSKVLGVGVAAMVGSRGCYGSCKYCSIHAWHESADGPRYRQRSVDDLVDEMAWLRTHQQVQLYNFHDDNFFVPSRSKNQARFEGIARALDERGIDDVAIMLKCRPDDLDDGYAQLLERIGLARVLIGVDTASDAGLESLGRGLSLADNHRAVELLSHRGIHAAFNLLIFDPDSTLQTIESNLDFLEAHTDVPFTVGAVRVFSHTPLEQRLRAEGRLGGTYLAPSYEMIDPRAELMGRVVDVAMHRRSFDPDGLHQQIQGLALELEMRQRFYSPAPPAELVDRVLDLIGSIGQSTVEHLRAIHRFVTDISMADKEQIRSFTRERSQQIHRDDFELTRALLETRAEIHHSAKQRGVRHRLRALEPSLCSREPVSIPR